MDDMTLYRAARAVADTIFADPRIETRPGSRLGDRQWLEDRRSERANAFYGQTEGGLFLEMYYGIPGYIHTPWGKWNAFGSGAGNGRDVYPGLLKEYFDAKIHQPGYQDAMGYYGPWYSLHRVGDIILPEPKMREQADYISYEDATARWEQLTEEYKRISR